VPEERDAKIGPTAYYTAYAWHRLGLPHADVFATPRGRALYWSFRLAGEWLVKVQPRAPLLVEVLAYRHRVIDRELERIAPDRVVEIGAGLSRRGITFAEQGVRYLEIDLPHMVREKERRIARAPAAVREAIGDRLRIEAHDVLAPDFAEWLARRVEGAARPVAIAEGVLGYFAMEERARIVRAVREALGARATFLCDLRDEERMLPVRGAVRVLRGAIELVTRGRGLHRDFGTADEVRRFLLAAGFSSAEPVEPVPPDLAHLAIPIRIWRASA
jgi:O-methyltransferase involved in polyketide biosynthesis